MEIGCAIQCPFCGSGFEVTVDTTVEDQVFITDCEVCCRPVEVAVECEPGRVLRWEIVA